MQFFVKFVNQNFPFRILVSQGSQGCFGLQAWQFAFISFHQQALNYTPFSSIWLVPRPQTHNMEEWTSGQGDGFPIHGYCVQNH